MQPKRRWVIEFIWMKDYINIIRLSNGQANIELLLAGGAWAGSLFEGVQGH